METLLQYIIKSVRKGELPRDFALPEKEPASNDTISFADGAEDGIAIYHMPATPVSAADYRIMTEAIEAAGEHDYDKAQVWFEDLAAKYRAVALEEQIHQYVYESREDLSGENLREFALQLIRQSTEREMLKLGLVLLSHFDISNDAVAMRDVTLLGLSDEFTLFVIPVMRQWPDANEAIFDLAKHVHGWGRVFAVDWLEPNSAKIIRWLLTEAVTGDVLDPYMARDCWGKASAEQVLRKGPTYEEFEGIRKIMAGLLDEGPMPGISTFDNEEEIIDLYLTRAEELNESMNEDDYRVIEQIRAHYAARFGEKCDIALKCRKILLTVHAYTVLRDAAKEGRAVDVAVAARIDVKPYVLELLQKDFKEHYPKCCYLADDPEYREKLLQIYEEKLPPRELKTFPGTSLGLGQEYWKQSALEYLMQELRDYPMEGMAFVEAGLQSEPVRTRNGALTVLQAWVQAEQKSLPALLPEMAELLSRLQDKEPVEDVRNRMNELLAGTVNFEPTAIDFGDKGPQDLSPESLEILADAISDAGAWLWWVADDEIIQLEFCDTQLYDETKPKKAPHSATVALRFYGDPVGVLLDNLDEDQEKKWYQRLQDDEQEPYNISPECFVFGDRAVAKDFFDEFQNKTPLRGFSGFEDFASRKHVVAGKCFNVGFIVAGDIIELEGHAGIFSDEEIRRANRKWWEYWKDYWRLINTDQAYEADAACDVTIPIRDDEEEEKQK